MARYDSGAHATSKSLTHTPPAEEAEAEVAEDEEATDFYAFAAAGASEPVVSLPSKYWQY